MERASSAPRRSSTQDMQVDNGIAFPGRSNARSALLLAFLSQDLRGEGILQKCEPSKRKGREGKAFGTFERKAPRSFAYLYDKPFTGRVSAPLFMCHWIFGNKSVYNPDLYGAHDREGSYSRAEKGRFLGPLDICGGTDL